MEINDPSHGPATIRPVIIEGMPGRQALTAIGRDALEGVDVGPARSGGTWELRHMSYGYLLAYCKITGRGSDPPSVGTIRQMICDSLHMVDANGNGRGLGGQPYSPNTIATIVYCLRAVFDLRQRANPCRHPLVAAELEKYQEAYAAGGHTTTESHELSHAESVRLARAADLGTVQGLRLAAMVRGQFDLGAAADEWAAVRGEDLVWDGDTGVLVTLRRVAARKTRTAAMVAVGDVDGDVDPVRLLARYVKARESAGWDGCGPLWVEVHQGPRRLDYEATGILGGRFTAEPWGYEAYAGAFGRLVDKAGLVGELLPNGRRRPITTYSNRSGMIRAAVEQGVAPEVIADRTGHTLGAKAIWDRLGPVILSGTGNPGVAIRLGAGGGDGTS